MLIRKTEVSGIGTSVFYVTGCNLLNKQLATAFHPELDDDIRVHQYFLDMI